MTLKWLHISDIHECKTDEHHRQKMYTSIIDEVIKRDYLDFVFITGDCAFGGTADEYASLTKDFIKPLKDALPDGCRLFTVPGNHDVERARLTKPRLWSSDPGEGKAFNAPDATGQRKRAEMLVPRFKAYADFEAKVANWGAPWIDSETGAAVWCETVNDAKVAVVGINTAWLAQDDDDWNKLTPGRYMVGAALDRASENNPDILIVLGHHPLEAMMPDDPNSDGKRLKDRLQQANALYLHGHMHASGTDTIGDALRSTLTIQAPSAFQAHDSQRWRNGLMWGEANVVTGELFLEPWLWNEAKREYKFDGDAGYNDDLAASKDKFRLQLPKNVSAVDAFDVPDIAPGWRVIDHNRLSELSAQEPDAATMAAYFDGSMPKWNVVRARGIGTRKVVDELVRRLRDVYDAPPKPAVVLLTGAGGEGKSTAVMQAAATLLEVTDQNWTCLQRSASAADAPENLFSNLEHKPNHAWVVVIDDAENIGVKLATALKHIEPRTDVHLLLCARFADWNINNLVPGIWGPTIEFHPVALQGLDDDDAACIVSGWVAWDAMGELRGQDVQQATKALLGHAHENAARSDEGALLGALLITRIGEDMRAHVRGFVQGLGTDPVTDGGHSLRDIYAMIAAMHAENQLYLSRPVLAYALRCDLHTLEHKILKVLRREAMLEAGETYVLTRHRRIAEAACAVLREDGYDVDRWYPILAAAARMDFTKNRTDNPDIARWSFDLARHFVDKGQTHWPLAQAVAKRLLESDPANIHSLTAYFQILRSTNAAAQALTVLKSTADRFKNHRNVLYEASVCAGTMGDQGLSVWLSGRSLADGGEPLEHRQAKLSLAGLGVAFYELYAEHQQQTYAVARRACGQLGLMVPQLDGTARGYFKKYLASYPELNLQDLSIDAAVDAIAKAVVKGALEVEPDNDPMFFEDNFGDPDGYRYTKLRGLLNVALNTK